MANMMEFYFGNEPGHPRNILWSQLEKALGIAVNNVRKLSTSPVRRVTPSSGKMKSRPNGSNLVFKAKKLSTKIRKRHVRATLATVLQFVYMSSLNPKRSFKSISIYLYIYIDI